MNMHSVFIKQLKRLRRLIIGMGLNAEEGEDILQDVYLEAIHRLSGHDNTERAGRWLMKVTTNRCLLEFRRKGRNRNAAARIIQNWSETKNVPLGPDKQAIHAEQVEAINQCLSDMDESLRAPLVMKYFCDMNSNEIGEILELKSGTVRKRICKGRVFLAETLLRKGIKP